MAEEPNLPADNDTSAQSDDLHDEPANAGTQSHAAQSEQENAGAQSDLAQDEPANSATPENSKSTESKSNAAHSLPSTEPQKLLPLPDVGDLLFCGILFILLKSRPDFLFQDASIGWHIVAGKWICEHHAIPYTDLFSYTFPDKAWVAYEWLFDVIAFLLVQVGGLNLLAVACATLIAATLAKMYDRCRSEGGPLGIAIIVSTLGIFASAIHWLARPHLINFFAIYLFSTKLEDYYRGTIGGTRLMAILVPFMILWVNCHPAFIMGIGLIGFYFIGAALGLLRWHFGERYSPVTLKNGALTAASEQSDEPGKLDLSGLELGKQNLNELEKHEEKQIAAQKLYLSQMKTLFITGVLATLVTFLNPYGLGLHKYILEYLGGGTVLAATDEFKSPVFHGDVHAFCLEVLIVFLLCGLAISVRRLSVPSLTTLIVFMHMALSAVRNIPLFSILVVPAIGRLFGETILPRFLRPVAEAFPKQKELIERQMRPFNEFAKQEQLCKMRVLSIGATLFVTAAALCGGNLFGMQVLASGFNPEVMPTKTLDFLKERKLSPDKGFNYDNWGGLIRWKLDQRVFIDDRADFYGEHFYTRYGVVVQTDPGWERILDENHIEWILMPKDSRLAMALKERKDKWMIACEDPAGYLFIRLPE